MTSTPDPLADRYGRRPARRYPLVPTLLAALVVVPFLVWLGWVVWVYSTPPVQSNLESFEIVSDHEARAVVQVTLADDAADASCRVRAVAEDKTPVADVPFTPVDGANEVTLRTEREATTVELVGCTAEGQKRPR